MSIRKLIELFHHRWAAPILAELERHRGARLVEAFGGRADLGLKKWSMPVLVALGRSTRFSELRAALPVVTPRALAIALKDLQGAGLATREVLAAYPPSTAYRLTDEGRRVR